MTDSPRTSDTNALPDQSALDDIMLAELAALPIERYLSGAAGPEEADLVERWVAVAPFRARVIASLRDVYMRTAHLSGASSWDTESAWARAMQRTSAPGERNVTRRAGTTPLASGLRVAHGQTGQRRNRVFAWVIVGACLVIGASAWWLNGNRHLVGDSGREYMTAAGELETVRLPDGTKLVLGPASRLRLVAGYGRGKRDVSLEGEAYFAVKHDAARPFAVRTRYAVIQDVGTVFDARAYAEDSATRITVAEGEVSVGVPGVAPGGSGAAQILTAGEAAIVSDTGAFVTRDANVSASLAWLQGELVFDKTPLREVVRDMSRTYGVAITVADSTLLNRRVTTTLSGKSLDAALTVVTTVLGARFDRTSHGVVIRKKTMVGRASDDAQPLPLRTAVAG